MGQPNKHVLIPCMPDGRPAPFLMNAQELAQFLRLNVRSPGDSIERMRRHGLKAVQVSRHVLFRLEDVLDWLHIQQDRVPR